MFAPPCHRTASLDKPLTFDGTATARRTRLLPRPQTRAEGRRRPGTDLNGLVDVDARSETTGECSTDEDPTDIAGGGSLEMSTGAVIPAA